MTQQAKQTEKPNEATSSLDIILGESEHDLNLNGRLFSLAPMTSRQCRDYQSIPDGDIDALCAFLAPILAERAKDKQPVDADFVLDNVPGVLLHRVALSLYRGEPIRPNR